MYLSGLISEFATRNPLGRLVRTGLAAGVFVVAAQGAVSTAHAQTSARGRYFPLDQNAPPGTAAQWSAVQRDFVPCMQPVRIELPGKEGEVSFFCGTAGESTAFAAPVLAGFRVGSIYRLKISGLKGFPGAELYPTIELIDHLHPPRGRELEFAIPITFTEEELAFAIEGRLVTKVIYLEQPDQALPVHNATAARNRLSAPRENVLALADEAGRPMAIIRIGGRIPDGAAPEPGFYGTGAPIQFFQQPAAIRETVRR